MVAHLPFRIVVDGHVIWKTDGLRKVDQPDVRVVLVVHEQQGTSDHLQSEKNTNNK